MFVNDSFQPDGAMDNSTGSVFLNNTAALSGQQFNREQLSVFSIVCFVIQFLAFVVDVLLCVAVLRAPSVKPTIKALLINILIANIMNAFSMLPFPTSILILIYSSIHNPSAVICRIMMSPYLVTAAERLFALAAFSAVTLAIVIKGISFITPLRLFISIAVGWVLAVVLPLYAYIPSIMILEFVDGVACMIYDRNLMHPDAKLVMDILYTFGGGVSLFACIGIPIVALCYINCCRPSETGDSHYTKSLARFGLFLVASNLMNLLGQAIPVMIVRREGPVYVYLAYGFCTVSIIPTPILIIVFFKPVRQYVYKWMKQWISCHFVKHQEEIYTNMVRVDV